MLEDVYKSYKAMADVINWKDYNQNDLFYEYIKHENDSLKDNFYAGIVCRFWGYTGRIYSQCNKHVPFEQCYDTLIDAINYVIKKRVWENPESSLYGDYTAPDKAFHIALKRQRGILLSSLTAQKRQSNFNTLSIDEMYENYNDATEGLFNVADESVAPMPEDLELINFIKSHEDLNEIITLDQICFTKWTSLPNVANNLKRLSLDDYEYYHKIYNINQSDFIAWLKDTARRSSKSLLYSIKKILYNSRDCYI